MRLQLCILSGEFKLYGSIQPTNSKQWTLGKQWEDADEAAAEEAAAAAANQYSPSQEGIGHGHEPFSHCCAGLGGAGQWAAVAPVLIAG
jgi:hypothetical protein